MHIDKACDVLTSFLPGSEKALGEANPHAKSTVATKGTKASTGKKGSAGATKSRGTRKAPLNPVTPRPKQGGLFDENCLSGYSKLNRP